ncbi:hypothetical protein Q2K19_25995 [Micromonospora soli]|nr:hypothetical protein [Micromonospora sp. NBRC 110009]WKT97598.1 hypothetical protein Q2K19_25995 [Micromonospora sp. NBRC 110009]
MNAQLAAAGTITATGGRIIALTGATDVLSDPHTNCGTSLH